MGYYTRFSAFVKLFFAFPLPAFCFVELLQSSPESAIIFLYNSHNLSRETGG